MIHVIVVDDHAVVRAGLRHILEQSKDISCTELETAEEALAVLDRGDAVDVVLLDVTLPGMSGIDALAEMKKRRPDLAVLILSMHPEERFAVRALRLGAYGYLSKSTPSSEIVSAVRAAAEGAPLSERFASLATLTAAAANARPLHETLTNREFEVLRLLGSGKPPSDVAQILGVSVKTVSTHREHILLKLRLENNMALIRYVLQEGLIDNS